MNPEPIDGKATGRLRPKAKASGQYEVVNGFNFGCTADDMTGTRVEPGALTVALPPEVLADLIEAKAIVEVKEIG